MSDYRDDNIWLMQGDCLERMKEIPDGSIDAIIIDPPYIGMVDQSWDKLTSNQASEFFSKALDESYRLLRFGGRFVSFCSNDTLTWLYQSKLKHRELLVIEKDLKRVAAGRNTKQYKQHVNHVEYAFVATKDAREYCREILLSNKGGLTSKEINSMLGVAVNGGGMWSIYTGENKCKQVPTKEVWEKFKSIFKGIPEYHSFEEVFNNGMSLGNVIKGFNFNFKGRVHPTQKPLNLVEYMLSTYTKVDDVVLDFTMGSGTTGVAAKGCSRKFIGIEKDANYFNIAKGRILND